MYRLGGYHMQISVAHFTPWHQLGKNARSKYSKKVTTFTLLHYLLELVPSITQNANVFCYATETLFWWMMEMTDFPTKIFFSPNSRGFHNKHASGCLEIPLIFTNPQHWLRLNVLFMLLACCPLTILLFFSTGCHINDSRVNETIGMVK